MLIPYTYACTYIYAYTAREKEKQVGNTNQL